MSWVQRGLQFPGSRVFTYDEEWWGKGFRLNPWAKDRSDRDYYLFVILDVISCRYSFESPWFIALSTATSGTSAAPRRMNTTLSASPICLRHCSLSHNTFPFHARIHKQSFIILMPFSYLFFTEHKVWIYGFPLHYFNTLHHFPGLWFNSQKLAARWFSYFGFLVL